MFTKQHSWLLVFVFLCGHSRSISHGIKIFACNYLFNYLFHSSVNMLKIRDFHLLHSSGLTTVYIFDTSFGSSCFCGLYVMGWCWGFIVYVVCFSSYPLFCPTHVFQTKLVEKEIMIHQLLLKFFFCVSLSRLIKISNMILC